MAQQSHIRPILAQCGVSHISQHHNIPNTVRKRPLALFALANVLPGGRRNSSPWGT
jgi:hypothetical protein